jgi:hypothetical protein
MMLMVAKSYTSMGINNNVLATIPSGKAFQAEID